MHTFQSKIRDIRLMSFSFNKAILKSVTCTRQSPVRVGIYLTLTRKLNLKSTRKLIKNEESKFRQPENQLKDAK